MAYEPKPGSFSLFKNERKTQDNHPDYSGQLLDLQGNEFWLSAWLKEANGKKFFSGSIKPKDAKAESKPKAKAKPDNTSFSDIDDEIPF